jgi:hypothetical protein
VGNTFINTTAIYSGGSAQLESNAPVNVTNCTFQKGHGSPP